MKRFPALLAAATAAATMAATAGMAAAQAATNSGWRVVFTHHYGSASNYSSYTAVAAVNASDAWVLGTTNGAGLPAPGKPVAEHWNGVHWRASVLPSGLTSEIIAASAASSRSVWGVTQAGGDILRWNGSRWSIAKHVTGGGMFTDVVAVSPGDVWAFGASRTGPGLGTWHFNGTSWRHMTGLASRIGDASAVSANDIWASALTPSTADAILHYHGTTWQTVKAPALTGLDFGSILALSGTNVWAVAASDASAEVLLVHLSHGRWTRVKPPWPVGFSGLASDGAGGLWLSAFHGTASWVVHLSAKGRWSRTATAGTVGPLARVPGTASLWGAGLIPATAGAQAAIWAHGTG